MKTLVLTLGLILSLASFVYADASDIESVEVREDVVKWELDTVRFLVQTRTCAVTYRKVDGNDNPVGEEVTVLFRDVEDNPETPEDESLTEFTQLINAINNGYNIKNTITNAVKIKLGIN